MNTEQAKKSIIEVLQKEFKSSKKDFVDVATKILDVFESLEPALSGRKIKESITQLRPDHKQTGHAIMDESKSSKNDDLSAKAWEKKKSANSW